MRAVLVVTLASGCWVAGCGAPGVQESPVGPAAISAAASDAGTVGESAEHSPAVPFHSEIVWSKLPGSDLSLCTHPLPAGKVYLQRNTLAGTAVTTHLGTGEFLGHTCVYGTTQPEGWFADFQWTAANGDMLLATSEFLYWTGLPGRSVAVDKVTFQDGGTGRFAFAEGDAMAYVNAPERTAVFEGALRYGKKEK